MSSVRGYYDGKCVQLLDKFPAQKNQMVLVTVIDESKQTWATKPVRNTSETNSFREALLSDKYVIPTDIDADAYVAELRKDDRF